MLVSFILYQFQIPWTQFTSTLKKIKSHLFALFSHFVSFIHSQLFKRAWIWENYLLNSHLQGKRCSCPKKKNQHTSLLLEYKCLSILANAWFLFPWVLTLLQSYYSALEQTFSSARVRKHSDVNSCFETEEKKTGRFLQNVKAASRAVNITCATTQWRKIARVIGLSNSCKEKFGKRK